MFNHRHIVLPIVIIAGLTALSALLLAAWRREDPVPPVILTEVERGPIRDVVPALGRIRAANQVEVGTEVGGRVLRVAVETEQEVQANDLLAVIDPEPFENALTTARARLLTARSGQAEARARLRAAQAELARLRPLAENGTRSESTLEDLEFEIEALSAARDRAEAGIVLAESEVSQAEANLARTEIRAPIDGFVLERRIEPGQTVNAAMNTPVLFVIAANLRDVLIEARVAEADVGRVREGMAVRFTVDAYPDEVFQAHADAIRRNPVEDGRFVSYAVMINAFDPSQRLLPGMTASVEFVAAESHDVLRARRETLLAWMPVDFRITDAMIEDWLARQPGRTLPEEPHLLRAAFHGSYAGRALRDGRRTVYLLTPDGWEVRQVRVGLEDQEYFEILDSDLQPGDRLLVDDPRRSQVD